MGTDGPGRLRIVAGNWRSRVLPVADVDGLRPTSERVRETLFNWLGPRIEGQRALDLFAGTGALGFEALSRGAANVVFVERSTRAIAALRKAAELLEATAAEIKKDDAFRFLADCGPDCFDLMFLDPPFADDSLNELCRLIDERQIVRRGGRVYIEQDRQADEVVLPAGWERLKSKTAGNVRYSLISVQGE
ncbi:MAG: 16S rRNA (guanine(966)-N(2))-methyltransferase RsmD [Pseudomonadota bacterium]